MKRFHLICLVVLVSAILSGCVFSTVDEMYRLPKRSEEYRALQQAIDRAMTGLSYCAPVSGQQRQTVQFVQTT